MSGGARIRAAIFDLDGTLMDSAPVIFSTWQEALRKGAGVRVPLARLKELQGVSTERTIASLGVPLSESGKVFREYVRIITGRYERTRLFPGTRALLAWLRQRGVKQVVLTAGRREKAAAVTKRLGIAGYFDGIISTDELGCGKATGRPFKLLCSLLGAAPSETLAVGDSPVDAAGARKAGCVTVALLSGGQSRKVLLAQKPDYVLPSISKLKALLEKEKLT